MSISESVLPDRNTGAIAIRRANRRPACSIRHDSYGTRTEKPVSPSGTRRGQRNCNRRFLEECERLGRIYTLLDEAEKSKGHSPVVGPKGSRGLRRAARGAALKRRIQGALRKQSDNKPTPAQEIVLEQVKPLSLDLTTPAVYYHKFSDNLRRDDELTIEVAWRQKFNVGAANQIVALPLKRGKCRFCGFEDPPDTPLDEPHYCTGPSRAKVNKIVNNHMLRTGRPKVFPESVRGTQPRSKGEDRAPGRRIGAKTGKVPENKGISKFPINLGRPCRFCGFVRQAEGRAENTAPCPQGGHPKTGKHQFN